MNVRQSQKYMDFMMKSKEDILCNCCNNCFSFERLSSSHLDLKQGLDFM